MAAMPTPVEATVAEYFAALRAMDVERWVNCFAPDAVSHDPMGAPPMHGHDVLRGFLTHINGSFASVSLQEDNVFASGNSAAAKWTGKVVSKSGETVTFEGIDVITCNDEGKIALVHAYWDPSSVMAVAQA
jgi:steroid delta-isomerase